MARQLPRRLPQNDDDTPFYETVSMPSQPYSSPSLARRSSSGSIFENANTRIQNESSGADRLSTTLVGILVKYFVLINGVLFLFFGCGAEFPFQRSQTIPINEMTPVKTIPRIK